MKLLKPWHTEAFSQLVHGRAHAWLLSSSGNNAAFDLALCVAQAWLCEAPRDGAACRVCDSCAMVRACTHPDLRIFVPETLALERGLPMDERAASQIEKKERKPSREIRVQAIRALVHFVQTTASRARGLVALLYPVERMNAVSANAVLKSLEEPAGEVKFLLVTHDSGRLLPTIRSRCQSIALKTPGAQQAVPWMLEETLSSGIQCSASEARGWLNAAGSPLEALHLARHLGSVAVWHGLPGLVAQGALAGLPALLREDMSQLVSVLQKVCHDALCLAVQAEPRFFAAQDFSPPGIQGMFNLKKLSNWARQLNQHARDAERPFNAGLMQEALLTEAGIALQP